MNLAERLRAATGAAHQDAEDAPFVAELLAGTLTLAGYLGMLRSLHAIYLALEQQLELHALEASIAAIAAMTKERLARAAAIALDLEELAGPAWQKSLPLEPAAKSQYIARIQQAGDTEPVLLVAHAYVRYLGDLSGGQLMRRAVAPILGSHAGTAIRFYEFGEPSAVRQLKTQFRDGLNDIPAASEAIVAEALLAFEMHRLLFDQLARTFLHDPTRLFVDRSTK